MDKSDEFRTPAATYGLAVYLRLIYNASRFAIALNRDTVAGVLAKRLSMQFEGPQQAARHFGAE